MLERASTCLEAGSRQLLRAPTQCLRTRRVLQSNIWHRPSASQVAPNGALLDFLYPAKTLALLKILSAPRRDASRPARRQLQQPPGRAYATAPRPTQRVQSASEPKAILRAKEYLASTAQSSPEAHSLADLLDKDEPGQQEAAWQLYTAIPTAHFQHDGAVSLRVALLEYLSQADASIEPGRAVQLFAQISPEHLTCRSYRAAIAAHISLRMVGPALRLLEDAAPHFDLRDIGLDVVLRRTVVDEQWDLSLRVFSLFLRHTPYIQHFPTPVYIRHGNPMPELWQGVATLRLQDHIHSFFTHARIFKHELGSSSENEEALSLFTMGFIPRVVDQILHSGDPDEQVMLRRLRGLFKDLRQSKISAPACWEHAIKQLLKLPPNRTTREVENLFNSLFKQYRQMCLGSQSGVNRMRPSLNLMRNKIVYHGDSGNVKEAEAILTDMRTFYPGQPPRFGLLKYLIHMYADHGRVTELRQLFDELKEHYPKEIDLDLVSALPYAHARRANVEGTIAEFNRIRDDFGLVPDTACWNILVLAYARADDLDGALVCFNSCIDNGISPDVYTFGPLLDLCAQRGDVEAFEAIFTRGKQMGVPLANDVRARSGYVQAFLNTGDPDGADAIAQGMLRSWQAGSLGSHPLTHTWNLLIQHHAMNRDLVGARQRYREMMDNDIPMDSWTYGSLMRALIELKQSNAAFKLLTKTMPKNNISAHALHYAIVMTGLLREGGEQLKLAIRAYQHMVEHGILQTEGSLQSTIRTLGTFRRSRMISGRQKQEFRLKRVEAVVESVLVDLVNSAHREPRHSNVLDGRSPGNSVQAAYGLMISLYAQSGSYKSAMRLLKKAEEAAPDAAKYAAPLTLITGTMEAHLQAGQHDKVAKGWELARTFVSKLSKTFHQVLNPDPPVAVFDTLVDPAARSLVDPSVRERYEQSRISPNRRNILYKAMRLYMRSLLHPKNPNANALQEAQRTMRDLLVNGYTLDTLTWNEYISTLAARGRTVDAFQTCETYLMPAFTGWRKLTPNYQRKDRPGYQWMELRHYEDQKTVLRPRYKTLVTLAAQMRRVRSEERSGYGYDEERKMWAREILETEAPMTIRAIETMPRTGDEIQSRFFEG